MFLHQRHYEKSEKKSTEWEKIFVNHIFHKGDDIQNIKRTTTQHTTKTNLNMVKNLNRHSSKKIHHMFWKHMRRCLILITMRKYQSKLQWNTATYLLGCQLSEIMIIIINRKHQILVKIWINKIYSALKGNFATCYNMDDITTLKTLW